MCQSKAKTNRIGEHGAQVRGDGHEGEELKYHSVDHLVGHTLVGNNDHGDDDVLRKDDEDVSVMIIMMMMRGKKQTVKDVNSQCSSL